MNRHVLGWGLILGMMLTGCGGGGGGGAPPPPAANLPPSFAGLKAIATAGGTSIRLCWEAANDDQDPPSAIRYRVYRATTRGTQTFASAALTTAPGATCVTLTGALGVREFFTVRALDTDGAEDDCTVELSIIPLASSQLVFVDDSAAGPGTGTFASPFTSLQDGITAAEALGGGGIVLVAAGTYDEQGRLTAAGANPINVLGGFPNWSTFGATQPSAATMLAAFDPETNLTTVSGTGITHFTTSGEGLVHLENNGRPTFIGGLRMSDAEDTALLGFDVDAEVSACSVRDPAGDNLTSYGTRFETTAPTFNNRLVVVGCDIREIDSVGVRFGGTTAWAVISSNFIGATQDSGNGIVGIDNDTSEFVIADSSSVVVPSGTTLRIWIERNDIFRTNDGGVDLDFTPEADLVAGSVNVQILTNRIEFIDDDDGILLDDIVYFGDGGSGVYNVHGNRITSTNGSGVEINWNSTQLLATAADIDGPTTVTITDNWITLPDDGVIQFDSIVPPGAGTASITVDRNYGSNIESTAFEVDSTSPAGPGPIDGRIVFNMRKNEATGPSDGDFPDLEIDVPPGPLGGLTLDLEDNIVTTPDSSDAIFYLQITGEMGTNPGGTVYNETVRVLRNILIESVDSDSDGHIYVDAFCSNGATDILVQENFVEATSAGVEIYQYDNGSTGPAGSASIVVTRNLIFSGAEEGIIVEAAPATGGFTFVEICHNDITCEDEAIYHEVNSGSVDGGRIHTVIYNNLVRGNDDDWLSYDDFTDAGAGEVATAYIAQNTLQIAAESSGVWTNVGENCIMLFERNFVGYGEVDSDEGLQVNPDDSNPGLVRLMNNVIAYNPGDGIEVENTNPQIVNNTVAFNGMGGTTTDYGIANDVADGQPFIHNSIVYRNGGADVSNTFSSRSLVGDQDPPTGFGNITGDPIFDFGMDLFDFDRNFRLRPGSPATDAGDPIADFNDPDGTRNDMGAYGGPGAGTVGSLLPTMPDVPLVILGLARPTSTTLAAQAHLYAGAPLAGFGPGQPLVIYFSRAVDVSTLAGGLSVSTGTGSVSGIFAPIHGGRGILFTPTVPVAAGSVLRVTGSAAIRAPAGGPALLYPFRDHVGVLPAATPEVEAAGGPDTNGTAGTAEVIAGTPATLNVAGTLFTQLDTDVYRFAVTAGERLQATVVAERRTPTVTGNFRLELLDTNGTTVLVLNDSNTGQIGGSRGDPFIDYTFAAPGDYYLRVTAINPGGPYAYDLQWLLR